MLNRGRTCRTLISLFANLLSTSWSLVGNYEVGIAARITCCVVMQSRCNRSLRANNRPQFSAVSIGPLAKDPYLLSSTGAIAAAAATSSFVRPERPSSIVPDSVKTWNRRRPAAAAPPRRPERVAPIGGRSADRGAALACASQWIKRRNASAETIPLIFQCRRFSMTPYLAEPRGAGERRAEQLSGRIYAKTNAIIVDGKPGPMARA